MLIRGGHLFTFWTFKGCLFEGGAYLREGANSNKYGMCYYENPVCQRFLNIKCHQNLGGLLYIGAVCGCLLSIQYV